MSTHFLSYLYIWPETDRMKTVEPGQTSQSCVMPGVVYDQPLVDKVSQTIFELSKTPLVKPQVEPDVNGLKTLIKSGHLRSAFNLTTRLLSDLGQGPGMASRPSKNSLLSFEIWSCRFQLLVALKLYNYVLEEISAFEELDTPDTFLQFYSDYREKGLTGSIVPFSLRLIHAEILMHTVHPWNAVERIEKLEKNTKLSIEIGELQLETPQIVVWKKRLDSVLLLKARVYYKLKDFIHSLSIYENLANDLPNSETKKKQLLQMLVRLSITMGDERAAGKFLDELSSCQQDSDYQLHKCFKAVFDGKYAYAKEKLREMIQEGHDFPKYYNNEAICSLYDGEVEKCLQTLSNHKGAMVEPISVNMGTIADLASTNSNDLKKSFFLNHCDHVADLLDPQLIKFS